MTRPAPSPRSGSLVRCLTWTLLASLALSSAAMAGTLLPPIPRAPWATASPSMGSPTRTGARLHRW